MGAAGEERKEDAGGGAATEGGKCDGEGKGETEARKRDWLGPEGFCAVGG